MCGADTQGAIGYALVQNLQNRLRRDGLDTPVVAVVTQVEVARDDPAFERPSKPVGSFMDEAEATRHRERDGWDVAEDAGRGWRRVVASPAPRRIVELAAVRTLVDSGAIVVAVGGGGIPVVADAAGDLQGVEAVIDKDLACSLLARELGAELFLITTSVERVALHFGTPKQRWVDHLSLEQARAYLAEGGHFAAGSMAPKMQAVIEYLEGGGTTAIITDPANVERALRGETGTRITVR
jgi:carbamate kinase